MRLFFVLFFAFFAKFSFAQCNQKFVEDCIAMNSNCKEIFIKAYNTELIPENGNNETGQTYQIIHNEWTLFRYYLFAPDSIIDNIDMILYEGEKEIKTTNGSENNSFEIFNPDHDTHFYTLAIRYKKGKGDYYGCAVGVQYFIGKDCDK